MSYFLKRINNAITRRSRWFLLALFPPLIFVAVTALTADRYVIYRDFTIDIDGDLDAGVIHSMLSASVFKERGDGRYPILRENDERKLYYSVDDDSTVRIVYEGVSLDNGKDLVTHFSDRFQGNLLKRYEVEMGTAVFIRGTPLEVKGLRSLWRKERTRLLLLYAAFSFLLVGLALIVLEFLDSSFKSERSAARYLGVPLLGSLPDANAVLKSMEEAHRAKGVDNGNGTEATGLS